MIWIALALAQDPAVDPPIEPDTGLVEDTGEPPEPWSPPPGDAGRQNVLGPWPDGYVPGGFQRGLDVIDPLSGRILEAGTPYGEGARHGPELPPDLDVVETTDPVVVEPDAPQSEPEPEPQVQVADPVVVQAPPAEHSRLLPVTPEPSLQKAVLSGLLAALFVLLTRFLERGPLSRLPSRGLVPLGLRGLVVFLRLATLAAVLVGGLMLLPNSVNPAPAYVFIGVAVAVGWTARDVLRDVIAGVVLVVEHRLVKSQRVLLRHDGVHMSGVVRTVGLRYVELVDDDGREVTVPNRALLEAIVHSDPDTYAPVEVRIHVRSGLDALRVRKALEELALTSPYLAPARPPEVHRDSSAPDVWLVRARLVDPRWSTAFEGAMVELADEVLSTG